MTDREILRTIDHTLLRPEATLREILAHCAEALACGAASACIPPAYVRPAAEETGPALNICTVIGFPLGYGAGATKVMETELALRDGAGEIDMVINIGAVKSGRFDHCLAEIRAVREACPGKILKVIVETCYLDDEEKKRLCDVVAESGADFIKTSTGFGSAGATLADVELFARRLSGSGVKIKAAGGVRTREDMEAFIEAGASRIGTSSALRLLSGLAPRQY